MTSVQSEGIVDAATPPPSEPQNPNPSDIKASIWRPAEKAALEIILHLKPTVASKQRRNLIVEYLKEFIRGSLNIEIFPFGSFPLKTYLPNGDIDLTGIGIPNVDYEYGFHVCDLLKTKALNQDSEFEVKDIQYTNVEVIIVKCIVQNIAVNISFNQHGGLSTLCFLEEVDRFIGRNHLFKRSIILIKAWCSYESCILGSHQDLLSTYALEILILYIFNFFHSSFDGPLAVLYRFLYYFSQFDWDNYCITLRGPVSISSLSELSVLGVDNDGCDLLLTEEFFRSSVDFFSLPSKISYYKFQMFTRDYVNIVDPLQECNNLGSSVGLCGFVQICSSLKHGARILGSILSQPTKSIGDEVNEFFANTLHRHGGSESPDMQDSARNALVGSSGSELTQPVEKLEKRKADELSSESLTSKACSDLNKELINIRISGLDECEGIVAPQKSPSHKQQNSSSGEVDSISSECITGDAKDLATSSTSVLIDELSDLSGDYDMYLNCFNYAVWCHEIIKNAQSISIYQLPPNFYDGLTPMIYGLDILKTRGTGAFFTEMNYPVYRDEPKDSSSFEKESHETKPMFNRNGGGKLLARLDIPNPSSLLPLKESPNAGRIIMYELKFGSFRPVSVEVPAKEHGRSSDLPIFHIQSSRFTSSASIYWRPVMNSYRRRSQFAYLKHKGWR